MCVLVYFFSVYLLLIVVMGSIVIEILNNGMTRYNIMIYLSMNGFILQKNLIKINVTTIYILQYM